MNRTRRLLALAALGAVLVVGAAACGSSDPDAAPDTTTTVAAPGADETSEPAVEGTAATTGERDCTATADPDNLSGDSVVLFAPDQDEQKESELTAEGTATISADGTSLDPSPFEVEAGKMFGIRVDGYDVIDAVKIGCAGSQTLVPGATIGFIVTEPGTYPISLEIHGTDLGTVVVH